MIYSERCIVGIDGRFITREPSEFGNLMTMHFFIYCQVIRALSVASLRHWISCRSERCMYGWIPSCRQYRFVWCVKLVLILFIFFRRISIHILRFLLASRCADARFKQVSSTFNVVADEMVFHRQAFVHFSKSFPVPLDFVITTTSLVSFFQKLHSRWWVLS